MSDCTICKYGPYYDPCSDYCDKDYDGRCCFTPEDFTKRDDSPEAILDIEDFTDMNVTFTFSF